MTHWYKKNNHVISSEGVLLFRKPKTKKKSHDNQSQQRQQATESGRALVTNIDCKGHWGLLYNELLYNFCIWRMSTHEALHCNLNK